MRGRNVGHQRVARRAADALAHAIEQPRSDHNADAARHGEQGFGQCAQRIAQDGQPLAPAQVVAERAGEHFHDECKGLGESFYEAHGDRAGAERAHHEQRQQAVDHLGGNVHEQADETQHPDGRWQAGNGARDM